nr:phage terminase large subunit family protein [Spirulina subsalsa]
MIRSTLLMAKMVTAPPPRTADEWARENRIMPSTSPIPGPFDPDTNPYMRPVAWAFAQPCYNRVTFVMGTQMGKSVTMENIAGHRLDEDPTPIMYVTPTRPLIVSTVEPKFMDMFRECGSLLAKYDWRRSSITTKWIGGIKFRFAWAGSATELAADSAGLVLVDEVDRIVNTSEGDTTEVIEARGDAYVDSKIGYTATPTHGKVEKRRDDRTGLEHWQTAKAAALGSAVWRLWQSGTRHEWAVPCPECLEYFVPWSGLLWWPGQGTEKECTPDEAARTARLCCPNHGCMIEDKWRPWMNRRGVPVAPGQSVTPAQRMGDQVHAGEVVGTADTEGSTHYSIWVSGLCSFAAKKTYGFLAKKLLAAQISGDPGKLLAVHNTGFGEVYSETGDVPSWEEIKMLQWPYALGELVLEPIKIYGTVDVQKNRLVYVTRAWFLGMGSALLEHGELWGPTDQDEVWDQLGELLGTEYGGRGIDLLGIDIGYRDDQVYQFINAHKSQAIALRGRDKLDKPFKLERVEQDRKGKTRKRGDARWAFDSPLAKRWVHSRIVRAQQTDAGRRPGWWLLPIGVNDDYCKQLVGEEWVESEGRFKQVGENHYLDCEAMQYVLALRDKLHRKRKGALTRDELARKVDPKATPPEEVAPDPEPSPPASAPDNEPTPPQAPAKKARFKVKRRRR